MTSDDSSPLVRVPELAKFRVPKGHDYKARGVARLGDGGEFVVGGGGGGGAGFPNNRDSPNVKHTTRVL